ncbi:hypothetical protein DAPPUDRAFT_252449 [Daphnia pulex]|uniref:Uncharacterized protein n=1 Tax=Daphnia pulex TaxID=6669 RepID=E9H2Q2_DAPPU|nr:hypothetical protein DAPPUDRAFT_252449 [Daphnia pulex]|eukprot:EFX74021.1 hypothetical protein DAPPUDRAFT_252449 [Daphnia pulex]
MEGLRNAKHFFKPGLLDGKDRFMKRLLYCSLIPSERMDLYIMVAAILELTRNVE